MNLPGFTAEFALFEPRKACYASGVFHDALDLAVLPQEPNTGRGNKGSCEDRHTNCASNCNDKHPKSADSPNNLNQSDREGCLDSCSAALRLCQPARTNWQTRIGGSLGSPVAFLGH